MEINSDNISLIIGVASFVVAIIFFFAARKSEMKAFESLISIQQQTKNLERINDNLLSTAIHHLASSNTKLIDMAIPSSSGHKNEQLLSENKPDEITNLIVTYFYTARSFLFASLYKKMVPLSEETKGVHVLADSSISLSKDDFLFTKNRLKNIPLDQLQNHHLYSTYLDLEEKWTPIVNPQNP